MSRDTMREPIPVVESLDEIYPPGAIPDQEKRWNRLHQKFSDLYGKSPSFISRSPGRVNIIGEHIDYSLYEVLPMAIAADVLIAVSTYERKGFSEISISNTDSTKFEAKRFEIPTDSEIDIDASTHQWTNYFKAGLRGAVGLLKKENPGFVPTSMNLLVDGNVPAGGGLSSSAAFVCASALAVLQANSSGPVSKTDLVELAIVSERFVGVNSGGMDQAASIFSVRGDALSVSFSPKLHAAAIAFPILDPPITFMIAQSFVAADKHVTAPVCYNLRVVECTLAAEYVAAQLGLTLKPDSAPLGQSLGGLQDAFYDSKPQMRDDPDHTPLHRLTEMVNLTGSQLKKSSGYTREEIADVLHISAEELENRYMSKFPVRAEKFLLRQRALHVFREAIRVQQFKALLKSPPDGGQTLLEKLGDLMNETQDSCRDVYECSCPELDDLCRIARTAGAYGSRLTGAGWGGCSVHLVPKDKVDDIRRAWEKEYFRVKFPDISSERLAEGVIVSEPGPGSVVYKSRDVS